MIQMSSGKSVERAVAPGESQPQAPAPRLAKGLLLTVALLVTATVVAAYLVGSKGGAHFASPPALDAPRVDGEHIVFSRAYRRRVGIDTAPARSGALTPLISVIGTTALNPQHTAAVGSRVAGLVRRVLRYEGDRVRRGELLAEIESSELGAAQANVMSLRAQKHSAELNAQRERDLAARNLSTAREAEVAQAKLDEYAASLKAAQQRVSALGGAASPFGVQQMLAPIDGSVLERNVSPGQSVVEHLTAFRLADLDYLWVELRVFERSVPRIREGDKVDLHPFSDPTATIDGRVAHVGAQIDPGTRTADVRVEVDNRARKLRAGEAVKAELHATGEAQGQVMLVPASAITYIDGKASVFVADGPLAVRRVAVELGDSDGQNQQLLAGVKTGEVVVTSGVFDLKSELFR